VFVTIKDVPAKTWWSTALIICRVRWSQPVPHPHFNVMHCASTMLNHVISQLYKHVINTYCVITLNVYSLSGPLSSSLPLSLSLSLSIYIYIYSAVAQWSKCCATNREVAGSIPAGVTGIFHWHKIFPIAVWPWGRLSLKHKWVPGAFPAGKDGRCVRLTTLPPSCADVMKSGNLNFLETSGSFQVCNGTALSLHYLSSIWIAYETKVKRCA